MDFKSEFKRVAIVTGAGQGLGLETVGRLAAMNHAVILTSRKTAQGMAETEKLKSAGLDVHYFQLDVNNEANILQLKDFAFSTFGHVDVLVNNAAIYPDETANILESPLQQFRETLETNTFSALRLCQVFLPEMQNQEWGRIVNVSSGLGQLATMGAHAPSYAMSKSALNALTRMLAAVAGLDIKINSCDPGWVRTKMGGPQAPRSVQEGANVMVWLATLPDDGPTGGFFHDQQNIAW